jgi:hypothetical protein
VSAETKAPLAVVCRVLDAPRSTVYSRAALALCPVIPLKRGPRTSLTDDELLEKIREVIRSSPFAGEGHRKITARLRREHGIRVGRKRVLRIMREAGLLAPQRTRGRRRPRAHDGTIIPAGPNMIWGTDSTMVYTRLDGWVWAFVCIDHATAEAWAEVAPRGDRFAALEPIYDAVRDRFGEIAVHVGALPGSAEVAGHRGLPGLRRGAAMQRLRRAVHPHAQGAVHLVADLDRRGRAPRRRP